MLLGPSSVAPNFFVRCACYWNRYQTGRYRVAWGGMMGCSSGAEIRQKTNAAVSGVARKYHCNNLPHKVISVSNFSLSSIRLGLTLACRSGGLGCGVAWDP